MELLQVQWLVSASLNKLFYNIIQRAQLHNLVWRLYIVHCAAGGNNWVCFFSSKDGRAHPPNPTELCGRLPLDSSLVSLSSCVTGFLLRWLPPAPFLRARRSACHAKGFTNKSSLKSCRQALIN